MLLVSMLLFSMTVGLGRLTPDCFGLERILVLRLASYTLTLGISLLHYLHKSCLLAAIGPQDGREGFLRL